MSLTTNGVFVFWEALRMWDLFYVLGATAFFAAMLAYVRACEALGRRAEPED